MTSYVTPPTKKNEKIQNIKKRYRGRGKQNRKCSIFTILLTNLRGYKSKAISLRKIVRNIQPSVILINESQLIGNMKVNIPQYVCWTKSRTVKGGGGIATAVRNQYSDSAVGAGEGGKEDEYLITRIETFSPALCIVNSYGEQRKTSRGEVEGKWARLKDELETIRRRGEFCLYSGDLNKLVGSDQWGVPGTSPEISVGGKLLREMLATGDWVLVNGQGSEVVEGGPYTREDPATGKLSCLDLSIVSRELWPYVQKLVIDRDKNITPARPTKKKGKYKLVYSDHFSTLLTLKNLPRRQNVKEEKKRMWNLARENGWEEYKRITNKYSDKLEKVVEDDKIPIEEVIKKFDNIMKDIKFKSFGKVTINNKRDESKKIHVVDIQEEKEREEVKAKLLYEEQNKIVSEELEKIKASKNGRAGIIWEVRKKVIGKKKNNIVARAIKNPTNGKMAVNKKEIKEITLKYCMETLENNQPEKEYETEIRNKKEFVKQFMKETNGSFETYKETFDYNINTFRRKRKRNYHFITKAGNKFQNIIFKMCQRFFREEKFPASFKNTTLHMLYKNNSGRTDVLANHRFIHCKEWLPRVAEGLVVEDGLKEQLVSGSSIYQIGGQPGHRSEELMFVVKSVVARQRSLGKMIILQGYDVSKYFDKEMIEDGVITCLRRGADPKAVRLWYKLNDDTRIQVRTGAGMTKFGEVGACIGQGMIGGALVSQAVLDDGVMEHIPPGGEFQIEYGDVPLAPVMWIDDILNAADCLETARNINKKINIIMKQRGLSLNRDKSVSLLIGSKKD